MQIKSMIVFLNLKGKQNVEGEKGVYTVSNISQSNTHTYFFFHLNCWFLFIQLYPFFDRKFKNSLNLEVNR